EKEAEGIKKEAGKEIDELKKKLNDATKKASEKILASFKMEMEKKVKQARFKKEAELKTLSLQKKQEVIEKVYDMALDKLASGEGAYQQVIEQAVERMPQVSDGEIVLAEGKRGETEIIVKKSRPGSGRDKPNKDYKIATQTVKSKGGFVLESPSLRIDNTLESLVEQVKDETGVEVAKVLFE
ncbi:hypothetical protein HQ544_02475, partial [Candidatus Falkowbacteria bacterium]|nr:hypothetical protein [Candidatus Falkowbacteria bacterium]